VTPTKLSLGSREIHLQVALDRLRRKYNLPMTTPAASSLQRNHPQTCSSIHGRYKHQSGGHGQFRCLSRNQATTTGKALTSAKGLSVAWYRSSIFLALKCAGVSTWTPGFPVVGGGDADEWLYHSVDSLNRHLSRLPIAMQTGMPQCQPHCWSRLPILK